MTKRRKIVFMVVLGEDGLDFTEWHGVGQHNCPIRKFWISSSHIQHRNAVLRGERQCHVFSREGDFKHARDVMLAMAVLSALKSGEGILEFCAIRHRVYRHDFVLAVFQPIQVGVPHGFALQFLLVCGALPAEFIALRAGLRAAVAVPSEREFRVLGAMVVYFCASCHVV